MEARHGGRRGRLRAASASDSASAASSVADAALIPGLVLATIYVLYIGIASGINKEMAPPLRMVCIGAGEIFEPGSKTQEPPI